MLNRILDVGHRIEIDRQTGRVLQLGQVFPDIGDIGFLHGIHELALKFSGHPAHFADELANLAQHAGQFLRANENQSNNANDDKLARIKIKHAGVSTGHGGARGPADPQFAGAASAAS